jgi:hypothetical protein
MRRARAQLAIAALALSLSIAPVALTRDEAGSVTIELAAAFAKNGGNSGHGGGNSGHSDGSGNGGGNSGSGSGSGHGGGSGSGGSGHSGPNGEQIEIRGDSIEVIYPDGWTEEVDGGRFELHDPAGRTVVERPATPEDIIRMRGLAP